MGVLLFEIQRMAWRERWLVALPVAIGSLVLLGYHLTQTPLASLTIWSVAVPATLLVVAMVVLCKTPTRGDGGNGGGGSGDTAWSGASSAGGSDGCGGDGGHC